MPTLVLTLADFVADTPILASEMNTKINEIVTWINGPNIDYDNLVPAFSGPLNWNITGGRAIVINNSGVSGPILITQAATFNAGEYGIRIDDTQPQTAGAADLYITRGSPTNAIPAIKVNNAGTGTSLFLNGTNTGHLIQAQASGVDKFRVEDDGKTFINLLYPVQIDTFSGPILSGAVAGRLLVQNEIQLGSAVDGPVLSRENPNSLLISQSFRVANTIQVGSGSGPTLSEVGAGILRVSNQLQIGVGPTLSNSTLVNGYLNVDQGLSVANSFYINAQGAYLNTNAGFTIAGMAASLIDKNPADNYPRIQGSLLYIGNAQLYNGYAGAAYLRLGTGISGNGYVAAGSAEILTTIRGTCQSYNAGGGLAYGAGFTSGQHPTQANTVKINFTDWFAGSPTVVATTNSIVATMFVFDRGVGHVSITSSDPNAAFDFIVTGPRV